MNGRPALGDRHLRRGDFAEADVARGFLPHVVNSDEDADEVQVLEIVGIAGVMADALRQVERRARHIFVLDEDAGGGLDALDAAAGDAEDDLGALRVLVLVVGLARRKDAFEDADLLGTVGLARDHLAALEGREAVPGVDEFRADDALAHLHDVLADAHGNTSSRTRSGSSGRRREAGGPGYRRSS